MHDLFAHKVTNDDNLPSTNVQITKGQQKDPQIKVLIPLDLQASSERQEIGHTLISETIYCSMVKSLHISTLPSFKLEETCTIAYFQG